VHAKCDEVAEHQLWVHQDGLVWLHSYQCHQACQNPIFANVHLIHGFIRTKVNLFPRLSLFTSDPQQVTSSLLSPNFAHTRSRGAIAFRFFLVLSNQRQCLPLQVQICDNLNPNSGQIWDFK
jgi:hypothetical protein